MILLQKDNFTDEEGCLLLFLQDSYPIGPFQLYYLTSFCCSTVNDVAERKRIQRNLYVSWLLFMSQILTILTQLSSAKDSWYFSGILNNTEEYVKYLWACSLNSRKITLGMEMQSVSKALNGGSGWSPWLSTRSASSCSRVLGRGGQWVCWRQGNLRKRWFWHSHWEAEDLVWESNMERALPG